MDSSQPSLMALFSSPFPESNGKVTSERVLEMLEERCEVLKKDKKKIKSKEFVSYTRHFVGCWRGRHPVLPALPRLLPVRPCLPRPPPRPGALQPQDRVAPAGAERRQAGPRWRIRVRGLSAVVVDAGGVRVDAGGAGGALRGEAPRRGQAVPRAGTRSSSNNNKGGNNNNNNNGSSSSSSNSNSNNNNRSKNNRNTILLFSDTAVHVRHNVQEADGASSARQQHW